MSNNIITIDGPAGVGKGTLMQWLASELNYNMLDSGAIYRLGGLSIIQNKIDYLDENAVANNLKELKISFKNINGQMKTYLNHIDVSLDIRNEKIAIMASKISSYSKVREVLLQTQKDFADCKGLVADGRDMGTVVFPDAKFKFFLDASSEIRAKRRYNEIVSKTEPKLKNSVDYDEILQNLKQRDFEDRNRAIAPLKAATDAYIIDTGMLNIEEVRNIVLSKINI